MEELRKGGSPVRVPNNTSIEVIFSMMELQTAPMVYSDALSKNLDLTKVEVNIPEFSEVLEEAVRGYAGKEQQARELLREYHHRYRNWQYVVQEAWRYANTNLRLYSRHP